MRRLLSLLLAALLLSVSLGALTLTGPTWSPTSPYTNDTLNCSWSYSADTLAQNITVLRNGAFFNTTYQNASAVNLSTSFTISSANTTKSDKWSCRITLYNETASTMTEINVTILNSPPSTEGASAGVFNDSGTDVGYLVQIPEDTTLNIDVNATDADGDTLTYQQADEFCTRTSSTAGTYQCAPNQSHLTNNQPTQYNITFTVSDGQNVGGRTITFNVTPVNDAPIVSVSNQATPVNQTLNATFSASDDEANYPLSYELIFNGSNSEIQPKLSLARLNVNGTSISVYYDASSPDFNDVGYWPVYVNVTDNSTDVGGQNDSRSALYTFYINITAVGRRPYFTNITPDGPYNVSQGQTIQINISANDADANTTITFSDDTAKFNIATVKGNTNGSDATGQINYTAVNADVGLFNVTITITDAESLTNTTIIQFNVTNVNDAPTVHEVSLSGANTQENQNASNLTAYANTLFVYDVNATDPDTIHGDSLNYSDNASIFDINSTTGRISFTPTDAQIGSHSINISVTDQSGASASRIINLTVFANTPPYFNVTPMPQLNCTTDASCSFDLSSVSTDTETSVASYTVAFVNGTLASFAYNVTSGMINFTPTKYDVGNYTINVTINDTFGATNWSLMNISINNTPVAPNLTRFNFSGQTIVETHPFSFELQADDRDFIVTSANEAVNFTTNLSINHTIAQLANSNITARATLSFTPGLGTAGNHTIQINATDAFGLVSQRNITFEIYAKVPAPNITEVTPWGLGTTFDIQTTYANASSFSNNLTRVNMSENTTVLFNATVNDTRSLTYNWTVNGTQVSTAANYTRVFNFFSAGEYIVRLNVSNDRLEHSLWTWNVTVRNTNRAPTLQNNLTTPLLVNTTHTFSSYFTASNGTKFLDPDDDTDSSGAINGNESNTLTFSTASSCSAATISISGSDLTLTPVAVGSCQVRFNASDGSLSAESNIVTINVTDVPEGESETETTTSSGGSSSTTSTYIPISNDKKTPQAFHLIAPKLVTIYSNKSLDIPVIVNNTWHEPLKFLQLGLETNATDVEVSLSADLFEEIPVNESREVTLTVTNYRFGSNYEIRVVANVSDPEYEDEALILLNSIESSSDGDQVNVKVTFANDLLNEHPECQELNEVLDEAKQRISENNLDEAKRLVEGVINGCKYLVSMQQKVQEKPSKVNPIITIDNLSLRTIMWSVLAFVVLLSIALLALYHYTHKPEDDI